MYARHCGFSLVEACYAKIGPAGPILAAEIGGLGKTESGSGRSVGKIRRPGTGRSRE